MAIAVSVVISGIVVLTLSLALAAILLKPGTHKKNRFFLWFNDRFERLTQGYGRGVQLAMRRMALSLLLIVAMVAATASPAARSRDRCAPRRGAAARSAVQL